MGEREGHPAGVFAAVPLPRGTGQKPLATPSAERFNLMTRLGCRRLAG